ncbi:MAG: thermonuclease family protein [Chloroflexia bacterium]|nr:thermonuclease family protein [Chloroflexia bacterium]
MAFDSTSPGRAPRRSTPSTPTEAPRPGAELWHALRDEGIQWDGQVLVVGSGTEIPALLVLTGERLAMIHEGTLALEAPRSWLRPEPRLLSANGVRISVTPQGGAGRVDETDRLSVRVRDGRGAAAKLVSAASGRLVSPREEPRISQPEARGEWANAIGASTPIALPPLPDFGYDPDVAPETARAKQAWPPVEQHGIPSSATPARAREAATGPLISAWAAANLDGPSDSAVATPRSSRSTWPKVKAEDAPPPADEEHHQFHRGLVWGLRSVILAVLIFAGLYFGRDSLPANVDFTLPANIERRLGFDERDDPDISQVEDDQSAGSGVAGETPEPTTADSDGTSGPPNGDQIATSNPDDAGTGGQEGEITPADPGIGDYAEPTDVPIEPTTALEAAPTDPPAEPTSPSEESTDPPVTEAPEDQAPATDEPAPDVPATEAPTTEVPATDVPATETVAPGEPTEVPGRQEPAIPDEATEVLRESTEVPTTEEPDPTLESQPASVDPGSTPEQALASGAFRYSITGAARGETVSELPDLASVGGYGEWVVLSMYGENWSDARQVFDVSEFRLYADGEEMLVDVGNAWVSGLLGHTPAYGNTDAILWAADEGHPFALTFLVPPDAQQLTLVAGDQEIDLSSALDDPAPLAQDASEAATPGYVDAEVVDVLSAEEIVIEIDGVRQTVRYLGLDVPTDDDCYAAEATAANRELVEGETVRLERQATDVDARGNWVRDVWAPAEDGRYFLVSEALVAEGAATAGISEPNTRYEGWLLGSQSIAKAEGLGLWGACEGAITDIAEPQAAVAPTLNRATYRRTSR